MGRKDESTETYDTIKLPANDQAERACLSAIMLNPASVVDLQAKLSSNDFHNERHKIIYSAMITTFNRHSNCDPIAVIEECKKSKFWTDDLSDYIVDMMSGVPVIANLDYYATTVLEKSRLRQLVKACSAIIGDCEKQIDTADEILNGAGEKVFAIAQNRFGGGLYKIGDKIKENLDRLEKRNRSDGYDGIRSGYSELDDLTRGMSGGSFHVLAARPSVGKSALAMNIALNAALKEGAKVALFSLEMSDQEIFERMIASLSRVFLAKVKNGDFSDQRDQMRITGACTELMNSAISINEKTDISAVDVRVECRAMKMRHGLDLIIIDYLQLMRCHGDLRGQSKATEVGIITRYLKVVARELNVPILLLSQLSREVEKREGKRPVLSDLRDSGAIEQDADVVMFLYDESAPVAGKIHNPSGISEIELIVAKNRNGATGNCKLRFDKRVQKFDEMFEHSDKDRVTGGY